MSLESFCSFKKGILYILIMYSTHISHEILSLTLFYKFLVYTITLPYVVKERLTFCYHSFKMDNIRIVKLSHDWSFQQEIGFVLFSMVALEKRIYMFHLVLAHTIRQVRIWAKQSCIIYCKMKDSITVGIILLGPAWNNAAK